MWQIWLIVSGAFFILEMITIGFLVFWLGIGALISMIVSLFTDNILIQTSVFVTSSTALIFLTKPFVKKFTKKDEHTSTNAASIIGKKAIVIQDIDVDQGTGQIKVQGEVWSAKSINSKIILKDTMVIIEEIQGVKTVVKTF